MQERSIKAVMISQQQAKDLGAQEVRGLRERREKEIKLLPPPPYCSLLLPTFFFLPINHKEITHTAHFNPTQPPSPSQSQSPQSASTHTNPQHTSPTTPKQHRKTKVTTDHVLLGLIAEDEASKRGYLDTGLTHERVRAAVEMLTGRRKPILGEGNIPFSKEVRRTFEAATNVRERERGMRRGGE